MLDFVSKMMNFALKMMEMQALGLGKGAPGDVRDQRQPVFLDAGAGDCDQ